MRNSAPSSHSHRSGPTWLQAIAMALALAFLTGAAVTYVDNREPEPNAADVGFLDDMNLHHQQAIVISFAYLKFSEPGFPANTANEIVRHQSGDLRVMQDLRSTWSQEDPDGDDGVMAWMDMPSTLADMPGYASNDDVLRLDTLRGRELDDLFTTLMIRHHLGGIHMAEQAEKRANVDRVRDLATTMARLQTREIDDLNQWRESAGLAAVTKL